MSRREEHETIVFMNLDWNSGQFDQTSEECTIDVQQEHVYDTH
jgi:hypothetical protein